MILDSLKNSALYYGVNRGMEALLVGHVLQFHGFTRHVVGFLLVGEVHGDAESGLYGE